MGTDPATPPRPSAPAPAPQRSIELRDPPFAAFLAWLVPGLGHLYQRRYFKAALYSVCILSLFFGGVALGDEKVVQWSWKEDRRTYGYTLQALVGLPSLPAIWQARRFPNLPPNKDPYYRRELNRLDRPVDGPFTGLLVTSFDETGEVRLQLEGRLSMQPDADGRVTGSLEGRVVAVVSDHELEGLPDTLKLTIDSLRNPEPAVFPSPDRFVEAAVSGDLGEDGETFRGTLTGTVKGGRTFWNRYAAPLDSRGLDMAHAELGRWFDLGLIFTWIAGLLNLLAILDALEGPAHGITDEDYEEGEPAPQPAAA